MEEVQMRDSSDLPRVRAWSTTMRTSCKRRDARTQALERLRPDRLRSGLEGRFARMRDLNDRFEPPERRAGRRARECQNDADEQKTERLPAASRHQRKSMRGVVARKKSSSIPHRLDDGLKIVKSREPRGLVATLLQGSKGAWKPSRPRAGRRRVGQTLPRLLAQGLRMVRSSSAVLFVSKSSATVLKWSAIAPR